MASPSSGFEIDATAFTELQKRLKNFDKKLAREMNKEVRKVAAPVVADVKAAALRLPSSKGKNKNRPPETGLGLRQGIAQATEFRMFYQKNGARARIRVSGTKFEKVTDGKYKKLPRYVEGMGRKPWRHPVWASKGDRNGTWRGEWVTQKPTPFLLPTALKQKDAVRTAIVNVFINEVNTQLAAGNRQLFS